MIDELREFLRELRRAMKAKWHVHRVGEPRLVQDSDGLTYIRFRGVHL